MAAACAFLCAWITACISSRFLFPLVWSPSHYLASFSALLSFPTLSSSIILFSYGARLPWWVLGQTLHACSKLLSFLKGVASSPTWILYAPSLGQPPNRNSHPSYDNNIQTEKRLRVTRIQKATLCRWRLPRFNLEQIHVPNTAVA